MAPSKAIAMASGKAERIAARSKAGSDGAGNVCGTPPKREPMVATSRLSIAVITAVTATATRKPGHFGRYRRSPTMMPMARTDKASVAGLIVLMLSPMAHSFGSNAAGSLAMLRPSSSFTWLAKMMTAIPAVNPTVTGSGIYLM